MSGILNLESGKLGMNLCPITGELRQVNFCEPYIFHLQNGAKKSLFPISLCCYGAQIRKYMQVHFINSKLWSQKKVFSVT